MIKKPQGAPKPRKLFNRPGTLLVEENALPASSAPPPLRLDEPEEEALAAGDAEDLIEAGEADPSEEGLHFETPAPTRRVDVDGMRARTARRIAEDEEELRVPADLVETIREGVSVVDLSEGPADALEPEITSGWDDPEEAREGSNGVVGAVVRVGAAPAAAAGAPLLAANTIPPREPVPPTSVTAEADAAPTERMPARMELKLTEPVARRVETPPTQLLEPVLPPPAARPAPVPAPPVAPVTPPLAAPTVVPPEPAPAPPRGTHFGEPHQAEVVRGLARPPAPAAAPPTPAPVPPSRPAPAAARPPVPTPVEVTRTVSPAEAPRREPVPLREARAAERGDAPSGLPRWLAPVAVVAVLVAVGAFGLGRFLGGSPAETPPAPTPAPAAPTEATPAAPVEAAPATPVAAAPVETPAAATPAPTPVEATPAPAVPKRVDTPAPTTPRTAVDTLASSAPPVTARTPAAAAATAPADATPTGLIQIVSDMSCLVIVDGKQRGYAPNLGPIELTAGTHIVRAVVPGKGYSRTVEVRVDAGLLRQVEVRFGE